MKKCVQAITKAKRIFLLSHINPDGDSIGSIMALYYSFYREKETYIISKKNPPPVFSYLFNSQINIFNNNYPQNYTKEDVLIVVDVSDKNRTEEPAAIDFFAQNEALLFIDHHAPENIFHVSSAKIHETEASSTSELIYLLLKNAQIKINAQIAQCLLTGIYTDTGGFIFENVTPRCLSIVSELLRSGGKIDQITGQINPSKSINNLKLTGLALKRVFIANKCAISYLTLNDQISINSTETDLLGIANQINTLNNIKLSLLIIQADKNSIRGILRNKSKKIDLSLLAYFLGGGGHAMGAGFTLKGTIKTINNKIFIEK